MREEPEVGVKAIRLDSGDLGELAKGARALLDEAGLEDITIVASSGLDEHKITALLEDGAPIDAFGVGTEMGVSADAPVIDLSYKLVAYAGTPRLKHSPGKVNLPGGKQLYRRLGDDGRYAGDVIALRDEPDIAGEPLLRPLVVGGAVDARELALADGAPERVRDALGRLPEALLSLAPGEAPYPVALSPGLEALRRRL
jgi:nicotinate phosphoribosyltransferase